MPQARTPQTVQPAPADLGTAPAHAAPLAAPSVVAGVAWQQKASASAQANAAGALQRRARAAAGVVQRLKPTMAPNTSVPTVNGAVWNALKHASPMKLGRIGDYLNLADSKQSLNRAHDSQATITKASTRDKERDAASLSNFTNNARNEFRMFGFASAPKSWDAGHLIASELLDGTGNKDSFADANIAPQSAHFNEENYRVLETAIKDLVQVDPAIAVDYTVTVNYPAPHNTTLGDLVPLGFFRQGLQGANPMTAVTVERFIPNAWTANAVARIDAKSVTPSPALNSALNRFKALGGIAHLSEPTLFDSFRVNSPSVSETTTGTVAHHRVQMDARQIEARIATRRDALGMFQQFFPYAPPAAVSNLDLADRSGLERSGFELLSQTKAQATLEWSSLLETIAKVSPMLGGDLPILLMEFNNYIQAIEMNHLDEIRKFREHLEQLNKKDSINIGNSLEFVRKEHDIVIEYMTQIGKYVERARIVKQQLAQIDQRTRESKRIMTEGSPETKRKLLSSAREQMTVDTGQQNAVNMSPYRGFEASVLDFALQQPSPSLLSSSVDIDPPWLNQIDEYGSYLSSSQGMPWPTNQSPPRPIKSARVEQPPTDTDKMDDSK